MTTIDKLVSLEPLFLELYLLTSKVEESLAISGTTSARGTPTGMTFSHPLYKPLHILKNHLNLLLDRTFSSHPKELTLYSWMEPFTISPYTDDERDQYANYYFKEIQERDIVTLTAEVFKGTEQREQCERLVSLIKDTLTR